MAEQVATLARSPREWTSLRLGQRARRRQRMVAALGTGGLLAVTCLSSLAVLFIFYFVARDALPFFRLRGFREFFTSTRWYPTAATPEFGAAAILAGTGIVTAGAIVMAVPLAVVAAVCLSDVLPFAARQVVKPVIEMLAAIPSVAYGFFALVVLAPLLQTHGGRILAVAQWLVGAPLAALFIVVLADGAARRVSDRHRAGARWLIAALSGGVALAALWCGGRALARLHIASGTNALNVALVLGIMVLPTVVSVAEDALQAVGRELREASYALGATRAETIVKAVLPAAAGGVLAAVILGVMRAVGETMVVWMASGNAAQIPRPWYNLLEPVRTLTATIAGDMGEADHVTGSIRYHVLFAMALCLLSFSFAGNLASGWLARRARRKLGG